MAISGNTRKALRKLLQAVAILDPTAERKQGSHLLFFASRHISSTKRTETISIFLQGDEYVLFYSACALLKSEHEAEHLSIDQIEAAVRALIGEAAYRGAHYVQLQTPALIDKLTATTMRPQVPYEIAIVVTGLDVQDVVLQLGNIRIERWSMANASKWGLRRRRAWITQRPMFHDK